MVDDLDTPFKERYYRRKKEGKHLDPISIGFLRCKTLRQAGSYAYSKGVSKSEVQRILLMNRPMAIRMMLLTRRVRALHGIKYPPAIGEAARIRNGGELDLGPPPDEYPLD